MTHNTNTDGIIIPRRGKGTYISRSSPPVIPRINGPRPLISDVHPPRSLPALPIVQKPRLKPTVTDTPTFSPPVHYQKSRSSKWLLVIVAIIVVIACTAISEFYFTDRSASVASTPPVSTLQPPRVTNDKIGLPLRLVIPDISIDTKLEYKGLTQNGALDVPNDPQNAAWYNLGPRPGEIGSAIIDGHFGYENRRPAIFDRLHTLKPDSLIHIVTDDGQTVVFKVQKHQMYGLDEKPEEVFRSDDGKSHLSIITCAGSWDKSRQTYDQRLVVFAERITANR